MASHPSRSNPSPWPSPTPEQWRELRQRHGLTQTQAGNLVCTKLRTVQHWEEGKTRIPPMAWELLRIRLGEASA